eukprot:357651-Chlamydomonas_euryale.AAC.2
MHPQPCTPTSSPLPAGGSHSSSDTVFTLCGRAPRHACGAGAAIRSSVCARSSRGIPGAVQAGGRLGWVWTSASGGALVRSAVCACSCGNLVQLGYNWCGRVCMRVNGVDRCGWVWTVKKCV